MTDSKTATELPNDRVNRLLHEAGADFTASSLMRTGSMESYDKFTVFDADKMPIAQIEVSFHNDETVLLTLRCTPEQAIAATLGRPKAKSHPYGYECDTGAYDCTRCECGCINDISATYCNDCGGEIEIDEYAEKEFYEYNRNSVFVVKHDDGTLEFGGKRYVPEDAATLGSEREKELEELVRDWRACDPKCTNRSCGDCEHDEDDGCGLYRRMHELGVIA